MEAKQIAQLRAFEKMLVARMLINYGSFLSEEMKKNLTQNTLIPDDFNKIFTSPENLQGEILRLVLNKVFSNIECTKNMEFSDGSVQKVPYGEYLKQGLIIYFAKEFSKMYNLSIDEVPTLNSNLESVLKIMETLNINFMPLVFNSDAIGILVAANIKEITKACDNDAAKKYIENINKTKDNEIIERIKGRGKISPPMYANGVQYIKYVDEKGEVHLIKSSDPKFVSNTYKELLFSLTRGEEPDAYKFYETLRKHGETIPLENEVDVIGSKLSSEESNMLNTIYSDRDLMFNADNKTTTHSTDMNVHLVGDKVAITDQNNVGKVTTQTFDGNVPVSTQAKVEENSELRLITEEEYAEICMKTVNGKELTPEDIKLLDYYDRHNFGETEPTPVTPEETVERIEAYEEQGPVLSLEKPSRKKDSSGFAQKYLPLFMVILTILLGVIVGISIFRIRQ